MSEQIENGTRVRFTHGPIGLLSDPDAMKFAEPVVQAGDFGTYLYEHPALDGWHIIEVVIPEVSTNLYAPVARAQFEVAS